MVEIPHDGEDRPWLRPSEVAKRLDIGVSSVYTLIREGDIEAHRFGRERGLRIHRDSLAAYVERSKVPA